MKLLLKILHIKLKDIIVKRIRAVASPNINHYIAMSRPGSVKKGAFKNFAKFTGKHLCQSVFFNKVAGLRPHFSQNISLRMFLALFKYIKTLAILRGVLRNKKILLDRRYNKPLSINTLLEKCPYSELFWSVFSLIRTKYKRE